MSDYTQAPATKLIATRCAVCARPLLDAVSVERGIGPDCWKSYARNEPVGEPAWVAVMAALDGIEPVAAVNPAMTPRDAANKLVHSIAIEQDGFTVLMRAEAIRLLGFNVLASRIIDRAAKVRVTLGNVESRGQYGETKLDPVLYVTAPYNEESYMAWRRLGAYWRKAEKRWCVPAAKRAELWQLLRRYFPGLLGYGDNGAFEIKSVLAA